MFVSSRSWYWALLLFRRPKGKATGNKQVIHSLHWNYFIIIITLLIIVFLCQRWYIEYLFMNSLDNFDEQSRKQMVIETKSRLPINATDDCSSRHVTIRLEFSQSLASLTSIACSWTSTKPNQSHIFPNTNRKLNSNILWMDHR